jgi:protein required for attachment to host cells
MIDSDSGTLLLPYTADILDECEKRGAGREHEQAKTLKYEDRTGTERKDTRRHTNPRTDRQDHKRTHTKIHAKAHREAHMHAYKSPGALPALKA